MVHIFLFLRRGCGLCMCWGVGLWVFWVDEVSSLSGLLKGWMEGGG